MQIMYMNITIATVFENEYNGGNEYLLDTWQLVILVYFIKFHLCVSFAHII